MHGIIVGIDPGTTSGIAVLDMRGNAISVTSSKDLGLDSLTMIASRLGIPLIVGTDKAKVPEIISKFSAKTGCRIVCPPTDLKGEEKSLLTDGHKTRDIHEKDALACALYAYRRYFHILDKTRRYLETNSQINHDGFIRCVIKEGMQIKAAAELLAKKEERTEIIEKKESEVPNYDKPAQNEKLRLAQQDIVHLRKYNMQLRKRIAFLESKTKSLSGKRRLDSRKIGSLFHFKEERIASMAERIKKEEDNSARLREELKAAREVLSGLSGHYVLKVLQNLGSEEVKSKSEKLGIYAGDILLVRDMGISSEKAISMLKEIVGTIAYLKWQGVRAEMPFDLVNVKEGIIRYFGDYAVIAKTAIDSAKNEKNRMINIVKDYRNQRRLP
ncbi:DUF460 domain-containing protein [Candidatus Woesearchaeota archaeon]|nr:DUF460 domain-containing protein [Candidatus Woesearchaeota archaeon]